MQPTIGTPPNDVEDTALDPASELLIDAWCALLGVATETRSAGAALIGRYAEPHRIYHDTVHLLTVLERIDEIGGAADDEAAVTLAAFFHDAVYDPSREDNEERSALLAESMLPGVGAEHRAAEVARLVRLTRSHEPAKADRNGEVLCDADLAVLGSSPSDYAAYAAAVRGEYREVDDTAFNASRNAILRGLLERPAIFSTQLGYERWEERARHNINAELLLLAAGRSVPHEGPLCQL